MLRNNLSILYAMYLKHMLSVAKNKENIKIIKKLLDYRII